MTTSTALTASALRVSVWPWPAALSHEVPYTAFSVSWSLAVSNETICPIFVSLFHSNRPS